MFVNFQPIHLNSITSLSTAVSWALKVRQAWPALWATQGRWVIEVGLDGVLVLGTYDLLVLQMLPLERDIGKKGKSMLAVETDPVI